MEYGALINATPVQRAQRLHYLIRMARPKTADLAPTVDALVNRIIDEGHRAGTAYGAIIARVRAEAGITLTKSAISRRISKLETRDPVARVRVPEGPQAEIAVSDDPAIAVARRDWVTIRVSECFAEVFAGTMEGHDYFIEMARTTGNKAEKRQAYIDARDSGRILTSMYAEIKSVHEAAQAAAVNVVFDFGSNS